MFGDFRADTSLHLPLAEHCTAKTTFEPTPCIVGGSKFLVFAKPSDSVQNVHRS